MLLVRNQNSEWVRGTSKTEWDIDTDEEEEPEIEEKRKPVKLKLRKYQRGGIRQLRAFGLRALLADEQGLGKTIQSLMSAKKEGAFPAVVICPASVKHQWQDEAYEHFGLTSIVAEGREPPKDHEHNLRIEDYDLLIINYDLISTSIQPIKLRGRKKATKYKVSKSGWVRWILKKFKPSLIIVDECHYLKSRDTKRTKAVRIMSNSIQFMLALSGTPLTSRPADLWPVLNMLRPDLYPRFHPYARRFCKPKRTRFGWEYKGASNLPTLHRQLKSRLMVRRTKAEVLKDLPEKTSSVVLMDIHKIQTYRKAEQQLINWIKKGNRTPKELRKLANAKLFILKRMAAEHKLPSATAWIDDFLEETDQKIVLFCVHKKIVKHFHERYKNKSVVIDGSVRGKDRREAAKQFNYNDKVRVLIGNIQAAGVGLNLQHGASNVVFVELGWTPAEMSQAADRVHRIGQKRGVNVYYLIGKDTIEHRLCDILQNRQAVLSATLDGTGQSELDIFDKLIRELKRL